MTVRSASSHLRRVLRSLGALAVGALAGLALSAPLRADGDTPSKSADETGKQTEEYWTPERMKEAKPAPMPHPDASKGVLVPPRSSDEGREGSTASEPRP